ncbi:MAG: SMC family ATPase, partial [Candidatus Eisenbacteria bacterium]|nr:SMC family ATPase [Candidatus Eisenbacteria bacterium]
ATSFADGATERLSRAWRLLRDVDDPEAIGDLFTPATPDDLEASVEASARTLEASLQEARFRHRDACRELETAREQLPRWQEIGDALAEARPVVDALGELTRLLADGKFVGHVVRHQQRGLLAIASELLRQTSGGRFGFAETFEVVDLLTGQVRGVKTLSGGETFLASLALALGLVELAGRAGGRLDALFLDEGFGSLDANCLAEALDALGRQASAGRLVAVISHLHAVAEAIDDVLLVTRDASGSRARWLGGAERDALVLEDAGSGLLV